MNPALLADGLVAIAWLGVALVDVAALVRERPSRRTLPRSVAGGRRPPRAAVALLAVVAASGFAVLERRGGRLGFHPVPAVVGLLLVTAGFALHVRARRTLGPLWSGVITVRAGQPVVERGPYAVVRHPIYASFLLLAAGSLLVHPSTAVACAALGCAIGIGGKIVLEERTLRRALGEPYRRYAARVPALLPRLRRRPPETDCPGG